MKKLVLVLAVAFSATLFSCNSDKKADAVKADSTNVEAVADTCTKDSCDKDTAKVAPVAEKVDTAATDTAKAKK